MRGIMFNYELGMWDAVLNSFKTNTRRIEESLSEINEDPDNWKYQPLPHSIMNGGFRFIGPGAKEILIWPRHTKDKPVYLQEPTLNVKKLVTEDDMIFYKYRDRAGFEDNVAYEQIIQQAQNKGGAFCNKMYMPSQHARYWILITDIRIERLQDISEADVIAEGVHNKKNISTERLFATYQKGKAVKTDPTWTRDHKASYGSLIKLVSGPECWDKNHWCLSYHFRLITKTESETLNQKETCSQ